MSVTVTLKVSPEERAAWQVECDRQAISLSEWMRDCCNAVATRESTARKRSGAERPAQVSHVSTRQLPPERLAQGNVRPFRGMDSKDDPLRR